MDDKMAIVVCSKAGCNSELLTSTGSSSPISRLDTSRELLRESEGGHPEKTKLELWNWWSQNLLDLSDHREGEWKPKRQKDSIKSVLITLRFGASLSAPPHPTLHCLEPLRQRHPSPCSFNSLTITSSGGRVLQIPNPQHHVQLADPSTILAPIWRYSQGCHERTFNSESLTISPPNIRWLLNAFPVKNYLLGLTFESLQGVAQIMYSILFLSFPFFLLLKSNHTTLLLTFT